jgi:hypothetical protein
MNPSNIPADVFEQLGGLLSDYVEVVCNRTVIEDNIIFEHCFNQTVSSYMQSDPSDVTYYTTKVRRTNGAGKIVSLLHKISRLFPTLLALCNGAVVSRPRVLHLKYGVGLVRHLDATVSYLLDFGGTDQANIYHTVDYDVITASIDINSGMWGCGGGRCYHHAELGRECWVFDPSNDIVADM